MTDSIPFERYVYVDQSLRDEPRCSDELLEAAIARENAARNADEQLLDTYVPLRTQELLLERREYDYRITATSVEGVAATSDSGDFNLLEHATIELFDHAVTVAVALDHQARRIARQRAGELAERLIVPGQRVQWSNTTFAHRTVELLIANQPTAMDIRFRTLIDEIRQQQRYHKWPEVKVLAFVESQDDEPSTFVDIQIGE